jgi:Flp pilus assembly protein TadD
MSVVESPNMSFIRSVLVGGFAFALLEIASIGAFCQSVKHDDNKWQNRQQQADLLIQRAFKRFALKDFKGSVQLLKEAATIDPNDPSVSRKLCEAYQWTNELDLAEGACQRSIKLDPNPLSYNLLGLVFLAKQDYKQAAKVFEKATADSEVPVVVRYNLLWALLGAEQYEQAVASAKQIIQLGGSDPSAMKFGYEALGIAYSKLHQEEQAHDAFGKASLQSCQIVRDKRSKLQLVCDRDYADSQAEGN